MSSGLFFCLITLTGDIALKSVCKGSDIVWE
nr:MAG TPA: hypothetical protein [Caudoviricetes sp.]